jgi:superoxide dismutase, Fe-Mn family
MRIAVSRFSASLMAVLVFASPALAETFTLPSLPYAHDALEPVLDGKTMQIHHQRHHQAYVDALNAAVSKTPALKNKPLDEILAMVSSQEAVVRNNAGGHWNHSFFWPLMAPQDQESAPSPALAKAIGEAFGSMDAFRAAFEEAGKKHFGSGWVWLIVRPDKTLRIVTTPNQDNPLMEDAPVKGTPVLGNDLWEHAYYLSYQNQRPDYLKAWWNVVNWEQVSKNYEEALTPGQ